MQMLLGIPVAAVTAGKAGAKNAALFAIQILAVNDVRLSELLLDFRKKQTEKIAKADADLMNKINSLS